METVGSLIDKLCINELKIYHMTEQAGRDDIDDGFRQDCRKRLDILRVQRDDLGAELEELIDDVMSGKRILRIYRQMKMYNEKKFKD
ncbi:DUF4254 domain-containing protein [Clostridiaceae bacterium]|jgi:hypothetical protein|nr:DUF4254 domain-containing protein [Clostridiaceae bacterium]